LSFDSALDGLHAATSLQNSFLRRKIPVRIGMHMGDVLYKNNNAFGDGVNVASRIESLAIPGAVLVSKTMYDQVRNKTEFELQSIGSFQFKNVADKMEVFAVISEGFSVPRPDQIRGKLEQPLPHQPSSEEKKEWEHYQLLEILDAIEEGSCVLILGNQAFSRPRLEGDGEIFLPDMLHQEQRKLAANAPETEMPDFYSSAQALVKRPGGHRKLMGLADIRWEDLGPQQRERFQRLSQIPFDLILSTYPFDLCHQAFEALGINHQYDFYSFLSEATEPEPFDAKRPLIYNLFGSKRHKESMVLTLDQLYQFFFAVLGARHLPTLIQDKVQTATQLVFLGFSFDDWYMKLLLRVLKVHEKDMNYAHSSGPLRLDNQVFYESNFKVTFLDRKIDTFVEELHQVCQQEGMLRRPSAEPGSVYQSIRSLVEKYRLEEAMDQLDEILLQQNMEARLLRELGDLFRSFHQIKEDELYERSPQQELEQRWKKLHDQLLSLIHRMEAKHSA
ncbi:MAG: SIR2 family protein, partial [Bacteroidia bacterium]|nr:SIR2 family protein [Bacteroidia bacterium]